MCATHPRARALALCTRCDSPLCLRCHDSDVDGLAVCPDCLDGARAPQEGQGAQGASMGLPPVPLEDVRSAQGFFARLLETFRLLALTPVEFFTRLIPSRALLRPLVFGYLCAAFGLLMAIVWQITFDLPGQEPIREMAREQGIPIAIVEVAQVISVPFYAVFYLGLNTLVLHLAVRLVGGKAPLRKTFQIFAYSTGALLLNLIPFVGVFLSVFVQISAQFAGLRIIHDLSVGRAMLACIIPMGLVLLGIGR